MTPATAAVTDAADLPHGSPGPLTTLYDVALLDLDGVVYLGSAPVPGAAVHLAAAVAAGLRLGFVTNNAARSPQGVAEQLTRLGVPAVPAAVITSGQTAARVLAEGLPPAARVLVVGTEALAEEVRTRGLCPVPAGSAAGPEPVVAVVQGYSPDTGWRELAAACRAVRSGAWWVASNGDLTVPSVDGPLPGNGAFVDVVRRTTGREPLVTGKPEPSMHAECVGRLGARRPLVVGDRLDTDIEGAARVGCPSMIVFTGVTRPADLLEAPPQHRPTYLAADLGGLLQAHPEVRRSRTGWSCRSWVVATGVELMLSGAGEPLDALRALCAAAWTSGVGSVRAVGEPAQTAVQALGLASG